MIIKTAEFVGSYPSIKLCPTDEKPEYAFIGRSNVGKSSLINMLVNISNLAHTSSTPGKTQTLNYFDINKQWYLVDLPGYGFAKTPKNIRHNWERMMDEYLVERLTMQCAFLLIDSCVPAQEVDLEFANWMGENQIPFVIVFTKADKKKAKQNKGFLKQFQEEFLQSWEAFPTYFISSANKKEGRDEILDFIDDINKQYFEQLKASK